MTPTLLALDDGRLVLPGNRFDLVPDRPRLPPPEVSVVVPYYEAQADLDLVLAALSRQTHPSSRLEVIVADDGSPQPPSLAAAGGLTSSTVRQERAGFRAAAARNLGARHAGGEILCFLDGDTVPALDYVERAVRLPHAAPDAVVVGRRCHADLAGWTFERVLGWLEGTGAGPRELPSPAWLAQGYTLSRNLLDADDRSFRYVISAVLTVGKAFFDEVGGFDESFTSYGGEDWELGYRLWNAGAVLAHEPDAVAWHNGPDWAGRGGTGQAKNAETLALARLIPEPETRGRGVRYRWPDTIVELVADEWSDAALYATVDRLLTSPGVEVHLEPSRCGIFGDDPRVLGTTVDSDLMVRTRHSFRLLRPCLVDLAVLRERLAEFGRVIVAEPEGVLITATRIRASARADRWSPGLGREDLVVALFGDLVLSTAEAGVELLPDEPDLAGYFAGH